MSGSGGERRALLKRGPGPKLHDRRATVTLVSFLCDQEDKQLLLPQIFLSNMHVLTQSDADALNRASAHNILFARRKSGWVNRVVLVEILQLLARCLGDTLKTHRVVLSMDTFAAHLHVDVIRAACSLGLLLMFIPASMTGWLQPLDVAVFGKYKDWVVRELEQKALTMPEGVPSRVEALGVYAAGISAVLEAQSWSRAFDLAGLRGQFGVSRELLSRLGMDAPPTVPAVLPSAAELMALYPRRASIPVDALFQGVVQLSRPRSRLLRLPPAARLPPAPAPPPSSPAPKKPRTM